MPTVEVFDGNLEAAISLFIKSVNREGIIKQYKKAHAFIPPSEQRYWENKRREKKARKRAEKERKRAKR